VVIAPVPVAQATHFSGYNFPASGHRLCECFAQVKIPTNTFPGLARKPKHRLRVLDVHFVFHLIASGGPVRVEVGQVHGQGFQPRKFFRQADGIFDTLALPLAVFHPGAGLSGPAHKRVIVALEQSQGKRSATCPRLWFWEREVNGFRQIQYISLKSPKTTEPRTAPAGTSMT